MAIRYRVELSEAERGELQAMLGGGKHAARKLKRAQILLAADAGVLDETIARSLAVGGSTVYRTKRRFVEGNLARALDEEPRPGAARKLSGYEEALLVATACSSPPEGRARWTLELLAGEMLRLTQHQRLSRETVRRRLADPGPPDRPTGPHLVFFQHDEVVVHCPRADADRVAGVLGEAAEESGRLVFGDTSVRFPLAVAVVDCYADAK